MGVKLLCVCIIVTAAYSGRSAAYTSSFYTDNDLGQSIPMGKIERRQQEKIKQNFLNLMGLYSKPKPKSNKKITQSASKFMRDLYESLEDSDSTGPRADDTHIHISSKVNASVLGLDPMKVESSDVIVSFVNQARKIQHLRHEHDHTFYFDFSEVSVGETLKGADLRLYKELAPEFDSGTFTVNLYAIKQGADWEDKVLEFESSLDVTWDQTGWIVLDATKAAENWTFFPHLNMGLYLKVVDSSGQEHDPQDIGIVGRKGPADKQSFLVGYMDLSKEVLSRQRRSLRNKRWTSSDYVTYADSPYSEYSSTGLARYRTHNNCQRHNLYINFRDIGFDDRFLLAPEGFSSFFCAGHCSFPLGLHMNATNHAIVQTLVHLMEPYHVPKPCCSPTEFSPITLLYYDDNSSVKLHKFQGMIVRACGCH